MSPKPQILSLIQSGQWPRAKTLCLQFCRDNANDPEAWFLLAGINAQLGAMDEVITCCRKVTELQPDNVAAHYNLGVALQSQKRHEEAAAAYREVLKRDANHALAHANLGLALRELGKTEEAIPSCQQALRLQPMLVEAHNTLGLLLKDQGKFEEGAVCFRQALTYRPGYAEAHYNLGLCHEGQNKLDEAVNCYRQALGLRSSYAEAHGHLGNILAIQGKLDEAITHYRRAVEAKPDYADAWNALGSALMEHENHLDNLDEAENCFRQALRNRPDSPDFHNSLAVTLRDAGKYDEALEHFKHALELKPSYELAIASMASLLEFRGEFEAGYALLRPLIENGTDNPFVAIAFGALARHVDRRPEAITMLERCLMQDPVKPARIKIHFTLGKLHDESKEHEKAFSHYHQANQLERSGFSKPFDANQNKKMLDELISVFSADNLARWQRATNRSKLPVFIVGMPRSGTSLVEQILASHPDVYGAGELMDIHKITTAICKDRGKGLHYPHCLAFLAKKELDAIAQRHLDKLSRFSSNATRVTDKMPHNFLGLGLIDMLFPGTRVIHVMRDPADTCLSIYFQQFNAFHPYACDLEELGIYYRQYERLMAHWRAVLRIPMMEVQYEELVANQEAITRKLIEFCELEWDERCLRFHEAERVTKTPSYDQVRRPMYKKSLARWKSYEQFLEPLRSGLEKR
jgi:tetratricopeptide (TPR) repeat protein